MTKNKNTIQVEGPLIVVTTFGVQTVESTKSANEKVMALLEQKDGPKDILVIMKGKGFADPKTAQMALKNMHSAPFRRMAAVGFTPSRLSTARNIYKASGEIEKVKVFHREEDARAWLEQEAKPIRTKLKQQADRLKQNRNTSLGSYIIGLALIAPIC